MSSDHKPRETDIDAIIGGALRRLRSQRGMTPAALALRSHLSELEILRYEAGKARISASVLARLCEALDTPIADLLQEGPSRS